MSDAFKGAVVVVPTRNRAALAVNAIKSVLGQPRCEVKVLVSDNSTAPEESAALARFCREAGDARLRYVAPPEPLPMTGHWEWALRLALADYGENHFIFLTDRMIFRRGVLPSVLRAAALYPDRIVSYHHDRIADYERPVRLDQHPWTGKLYEVEMRHLSYLYSQAILHPCIPRMLNCVAPRGALGAVERRFGSHFGSASPDYNFGCRCMEVVEAIVYYDRSPIVGYALDRSNGTSMSRGVSSRDNADFMAHFGQHQTPFSAAPIPEVRTVGNAIFHEYSVVKREAASARFFEIDKDKYMQYLAAEVEEFEEPALREEARAVLAAHGWTGTAAATTSDSREPARGVMATARKLASPRAVAGKVRRAASGGVRRLSGSAGAKPAWLFLARRIGVRPPDEHSFEFDSAAEAINYLNEFPRRSSSEWAWQQELLRARELPGVADDEN